MTDGPIHHTIDDLVTAGRVLNSFGFTDLRLWGHDHKGAYRILPVRDPMDTFMVLFTPFGPTLWMHFVLLFGSKAAVWAYGRFGDFLVVMARLLFFVYCFHYVDDYEGIEPAASAASAFETFEKFNTMLGCLMKESKRQPPSATHKMQGVELTFHDSAIEVAPTARRRAKLAALAESALRANLLSHSAAGTLAGKAQFFDTTTQGRVGRAATKPLHGRQHAPSNNTKMTSVLQASCRSIAFLAIWAPPRSMPFVRQHHGVPCVYADAYFVLGGVSQKPGHVENIPVAWNPQTSDTLKNGFGAVLVLPGKGPPQGYYFDGLAPPPTSSVCLLTVGSSFFCSKLSRNAWPSSCGCRGSRPSTSHLSITVLPSMR